VRPDAGGAARRKTRAKVHAGSFVLADEFFTAPPRCVRCSDVIGVYEPLVHVVDGQAHETSRAAEHAKWHPAGVCYHAECYAGAAAGGQA
jgi:hypothetical protein